MLHGVSVGPTVRVAEAAGVLVATDVFVGTAVLVAVGCGVIVAVGGGQSAMLNVYMRPGTRPGVLYRTWVKALWLFCTPMVALAPASAMAVPYTMRNVEEPSSNCIWKLMFVLELKSSAFHSRLKVRLGAVPVVELNTPRPEPTS